jgi:exoribonuclease R
VYTPGKVIPMLPEAISNDVCSLHPGEPKLVLSCLMTIDPQGNVIKTEVVEGIIESAHRGVYEEIQKSYEGGGRKEEGIHKKDNSNLLGFGGRNLSKNSSTKNIQHEEFSNGEESRSTDERSEGEVSLSSPNSFGTFATKSTESGPKNLDQVLTLAYTLYDILTERRKKEGKILFESSETVFEFASKTP